MIPRREVYDTSGGGSDTSGGGSDTSGGGSRFEYTSARGLEYLRRRFTKSQEEIYDTSARGL